MNNKNHTLSFLFSIQCIASRRARARPAERLSECAPQSVEPRAGAGEVARAVAVAVAVQPRGQSQSQSQCNPSEITNILFVT